MIEGLNALLGYEVPFAATDTGTHLTLILDEQADDRRIVKMAAEQRVVIRPLSPYYFSRLRAQGLLLGFAAFNAAEIEQGLARLARQRSALLAALPNA